MISLTVVDALITANRRITVLQFYENLQESHGSTYSLLQFLGYSKVCTNSFQNVDKTLRHQRIAKVLLGQHNMDTVSLQAR